MPFYGRARVPGATAIAITEAQFRAILAIYYKDVDAKAKSLTSGTNWIRMPDADVWIAPDTTLNPTMLTTGAGIANQHSTHRGGESYF